MEPFVRLQVGDLDAQRTFDRARDVVAFAHGGRVRRRLLERALQLKVGLDDHWRDRNGDNLNFENYLVDVALPHVGGPLVWCVDEADRLFSTSFHSQVFGLFRAWYNARSYEPEGSWANLTLVIAYATEAHLFITDLHQSPFNVGTKITLVDFTPEQVAERIVALKGIGVDLVLGGFLHFQEEVAYFGQRVLPLVRELENAERPLRATA